MRDLSLLEPKDVKKETDVECRVFNNTWTSEYIVKYTIYFTIYSVKYIV